MLLFLLGLLIGGIISVICWPVGLAIFAICAILSLFPLEGYNDEKLIETVEIIKLDDIENACYIQKIRNRVYYACDIRRQYDLPTPAREIRYVKGNVRIFEADECNNPVLKVYRKKPVRGEASIAPFSTKTTYVFYIPKRPLERNNMSKTPNVTILCGR